MAILGKIERYLRRYDMPRTKFGRLAVNDPRLVDDLRNGRAPGPELCERIEAQLSRAPAAPGQGDVR
ncbi:MAG: hypothetical protein EOP59_18235 [Sphingomonadales bacterium]|nr:MAG: hypothetical protein EOP59_18235 [Sphingomonadales bacterium]